MTPTGEWTSQAFQSNPCENDKVLYSETGTWVLYLGCLTAAYRATVHESTKLTPNMMMLGREVGLSME